MLVEAGADVTIVEYLKTPPSRAELARLFARAGMTPRQGLRMAEDGAKAVKHGDADAILDAMMVDPLLIERPLVETDKGVRLGPPARADSRDSLNPCRATGQQTSRSARFTGSRSASLGANHRLPEGAAAGTLGARRARGRVGSIEQRGHQSREEGRSHHQAVQAR